MSAMTKLIGLRIRNYRIQSGLNQEQLAELAGCHPTYIGQIERGEKNATIEKNIDGNRGDENNYYPLMCYELILSKTKFEQEVIYKIIVDIDKYKSL